MKLTDLDRYLKDNWLRKLEYGRWDCLLYVHDWANIKGVYDGFLPVYSGIEEIKGATREFLEVSGAKSYEDFFDKLIGRGEPKDGAIISRKTRFGHDLPSGYGLVRGKEGYFLESAGLVRVNLTNRDIFWHDDKLLPS